MRFNLMLAAIVLATASCSYMYEPALVLRTAKGMHQIGWLASQADMLTEDWVEA